LTVAEEGKTSEAFDPSSTPLRTLAARKGLLYGSCATQNKLTEQQYGDVVARQCDLLVPEVALKMDVLRPTPDTFDFGSANWLYNYAQQHQMQFRGHTLVWSIALPRWFGSYVNSQNAKQMMLNHINIVVAHYAGKMHSWDVINEALLPSDKRSDGLHDSPWLRLIGPDYIELAFRAAAEADPHALLVWNENSIEEDSPTGDTKRMYFLQHLNRLLSRGVPVHAIGVQSHLVGDHTNIAGPHFKHFLDEINDMGLKILITEMDIKDYNLPNDITARDQAVADRYYQYLNVLLSCKAVVAVLTWGMSDKYTWMTKSNPRADEAPVRPLPYDSNMNPKLAWYAIARAFDKAPQR
jgi:endo-1,4-beta-xylanase